MTDRFLSPPLSPLLFLLFTWRQTVGAIDLICRGMERHLDKPFCQAYGCKALSNISLSDVEAMTEVFPRCGKCDAKRYAVCVVAGILPFCHLKPPMIGPLPCH